MAGCALVGGETAEMPGMYPDGEYDLAGFCVGVVEKDRILDGKGIAAGDALLGLASSGPHSNGYSLVRKIIGEEHLASDLADSLMEPTRIYVKPILKLLSAFPVKGLAHITGGGLVGNVPRILPTGTKAVISKKAWPRPQIFTWLQNTGNVAEDEMFRVFNCGIGMVVCVAADKVATAKMLLKREGELAYEIGRVESSTAAEPECVIE